jgi:protein SCO1/2
MVTVDPQRDTPAAMHAFVSHYTPRVIGLTGSPQDVSRVIAAYHIWAQKLPAKKHGAGYDVAHSASMYLIDAQGRIHGLADDDDSDASLTQALRGLIG